MLVWRKTPKRSVCAIVRIQPLVYLAVASLTALAHHSQADQQVGHRDAQVARDVVDVIDRSPRPTLRIEAGSRPAANEYRAGISAVSFRNADVTLGSDASADPTATMVNEGDVGTYGLMIEVLDSGGRAVASETFQNEELAAGAGRAETMTWKPTEEHTGRYRVRATALTIGGELARTRRHENPRQSAPVSFNRPEYRAGISAVSFRNADVTLGSDASADPTATMVNEGDVGTYGLRIEVLDSGGRAVASETFQNEELAAGARRAETMTWKPTEEHTGRYRVRATALTIGGEPARTRRHGNPRQSALVSFNRPEYRAGISAVSFRNADVTLGSDASADPTATMVNEGDVGTYGLRIEVLDSGGRVVESETFQNEELAAGARRAETMTWKPTEEHTGRYRVRATALTIRGELARTRRHGNPRQSAPVSFNRPPSIRPTITRVEPPSSRVSVATNTNQRFKAEGRDEDANIKYVEFSATGSPELRGSPDRQCRLWSLCGGSKLAHDVRYRWSSAGTYTVTARVVDDEGAEASVSWEVTVQGESEYYAGISAVSFRNADVTLGSDASAAPTATMVNEGSVGTYGLRIEVLDSGGRAVASKTFPDEELAAGARRAETMTWKPTEEHTGRYRVRATALTIRGELARTRRHENPRQSAAVSFNRPPAIVRVEPARSGVAATTNTGVRFAARATDEDGNIRYVDFSASGNPRTSWSTELLGGEQDTCSRDCEEHEHAVRYRWASEGTHMVTAKVVDRKGAESTETWIVDVAEDNHAPTISREQPERSAVPLDEGEFQQFDVLARDRDTDADKQIDYLAFDATGDPEVRGVVRLDCGENCGTRRHTIDYRWPTAGPHIVTATVVDKTEARAATTWVVGDAERSYDLASEITAVDVLYNAEELHDFIDEQADYLEGNYHFVRLKPACERFFCRQPTEEDQAAYLTVLASKALATFMRVGNDLGARTDGDDRGHRRAVQVHAEDRARLEGIFLKLLSAVEHSVYFSLLFDAPIEESVADGGSSSFKYFAMVAYRLLHQSPGTDNYGDLYRQAENRVAARAPDQQTRQAAYGWLAGLALKTLHAEYLRTPKVPGIAGLAPLVNEMNDRLILRSREMLHDLVIGGPGGFVDLWGGALNSPIFSVLNTVDFLIDTEGWLSDVEDEIRAPASYAAAMAAVASCGLYRSSACLGSAEIGPWRRYTWKQDCPDDGCLAFSVPPEAYTRLQALERRIEELKAKAEDATDDPEVATHSLLVAKAGRGSVNSVDRAGINCGLDCEHRYPEDATVTLSAAPQQGWQFSGWSGGMLGRWRLRGPDGRGSDRVRALHGAAAQQAAGMGVRRQTSASRSARHLR